MKVDGENQLCWVRPVDHPVLVRTHYSNTGAAGFEGASPHLIGDYRNLFLASLRRDISVCTVERARPVFRDISSDRPIHPTLLPESCRPYVDANAFGYYIKNVLPLVFVRSSKGELLPEARVALKYLRENASQFASVLSTLEYYASRIYHPEAYAELKPRYPGLMTVVAQPYASLSDAHMVMSIGCYAMTPPGIATLIGPPNNQRSVLPVHSGLMETEWFHSQLVLVFDCPDFVDRVLVIEPDTILAQLSFVAQDANEESELLFSGEDPGSDPAYRERSINIGLELVQKSKDFVISETTGAKSVSVTCPHCWVSITSAAEGGVPKDHVERHDFYRGYKILRAEYHRSRRQRN